MAKGLSETQKKILKAIDTYNKSNEFKVRSWRLNGVAKLALYPELYFEGRNKRVWRNGNTKQTKPFQSVVRVVISKSLTRLFKRGLIEKNTNDGCILLTDIGSLMVNANLLQ